MFIYIYIYNDSLCVCARFLFVTKASRNPELAWGERSKARVRTAVKIGSGDASDAMDGE